MKEYRIVTPRTARYFVLGDPGGEVGELWFVCHGYGQLGAYFIRKFEVIAATGRLIVAPEALSRFYLEDPQGGRAHARVGASWMTREDRLCEIEDYVSYLDRVSDEVQGTLRSRSARVVALGFSQGAATVARWATMGRTRVDRLILWGDRLTPDLDLETYADRIRALQWVFVSGKRDPHWPPGAVRQEAVRLEHWGIPYRVIEFDGGHELDEAVLRSLARDQLRVAG